MQFKPMFSKKLLADLRGDRDGLAAIGNIAINKNRSI